MHYVICYDIGNDRLRDRVAKILEKNGCHRLQKSVFVAPDLAKKDLIRLQTGLLRLLERRPMQVTDHIHWLPLSDELMPLVQYLGHNNAFSEILTSKRVLML